MALNQEAQDAIRAANEIVGAPTPPAPTAPPVVIPKTVKAPPTSQLTQREKVLVSAVHRHVQQTVTETKEALSQSIDEVRTVVEDAVRATDTSLTSIRAVGMETAANLRMIADARAQRVANLQETFTAEMAGLTSWLSLITPPPSMDEAS